ncbi:hypothetical protein QVD17_09057 [Tagetes erecta]|uniref:Uncharacterized protein n=1 Tax=Tagetes erecta TaxID=13708 RepID=A0AAD8NY21_TARER|nr:hypothetical protein QVD17_09057 [Tagetes erecta]
MNAEFLDGHPYLKLGRGTEARSRLWRLIGTEIRPTYTIDWKLLRDLHDEDRAVGLIGLAGSTPWRRMFDSGHKRGRLQVRLMFYLSALIEHKRVNLAHCMASYFSNIWSGKMGSPIVCGAYVTGIASHLGLHTDDYLVQQTAEAFPSILGESTAIAMFFCW